MIPEYSQNVPVLEGEYILNAMVRNDGEELKNIINTLGVGDMSVVEATLHRWLATLGLTPEDVPRAITLRREQMSQPRRPAVTANKPPHWTEDRT